MKKMFLFFATTFVAILFSLQAKAILYVSNYTPIQYNIRLSDGSGFGISATSPATYTYPAYTATSLSFAQIFPHISWPIISVGEPASGFPPSATYGMVVSPMTTPFTVTYMEIGGNVFLSFYP